MTEEGGNQGGVLVIPDLHQGGEGDILLNLDHLHHLDVDRRLQERGLSHPQPVKIRLHDAPLHLGEQGGILMIHLLDVLLHLPGMTDLHLVVLLYLGMTDHHPDGLLCQGMTGLHHVGRPHLAEMIDHLPAEHPCQGMIDLHLLDGGDIPTLHLDHHLGVGKRVVRPQEGVRLEQIDRESDPQGPGMMAQIKARTIGSL